MRESGELVVKPDCIRPWRLSDAPDLARAIGNPKVLMNLRDGIPYPYTEQDALSYIQSVLSADEGSVYAWAITSGGVAVGSVGIHPQKNIHFRTAELGYYVAESHWGRGIATCAVRAACGWVFENTDILRIFAEPFSYNAASCRVLEKAGFAFEGVVRKNAVKNGEVLDMKLYARIKE
jgi:RimJ/RimL family protein N-acetyltransferase